MLSLFDDFVFLLCFSILSSMNISGTLPQITQFQYVPDAEGSAYHSRSAANIIQLLSPNLTHLTIMNNGCDMDMLLDTVKSCSALIHFGYQLEASHLWTVGEVLDHLGVHPGLVKIEEICSTCPISSLLLNACMIMLGEYMTCGESAVQIVHDTSQVFIKNRRYFQKVEPLSDWEPYLAFNAEDVVMLEKLRDIVGSFESIISCIPPASTK
jgi:hypothetical protein